MTENKLWYGPLLGIAIGLGIGGWINYATANKIPKASKVQQEFVAPNNLEVKLTDLDHNGEKETVLKIGETEYLLRLVEGKPVLSAYEVKSAEIQYKD